MLVSLLTVTTASAAISKKVMLLKNKIAFYTPHVINPKYFGFEIGYLLRKKIRSWSYPYDAYVEGYMVEESYTTDINLRAGALGAKAGVILPTQPWFPVYLQLTFGFAKTALHEDPWFGENEDTIQEKDMFLAEGGLIIRFKKRWLFRGTYQINNVDYFTKQAFFSMGLNF